MANIGRPTLYSDEQASGEKSETQGRPTLYKPEYAEQAEKLCALGATDEEMADFFNVSVRTIYRWKLDHEDFCHAIKAAKDLADERVERSLYQKATGYYVTEQQAIKIKTDQYKEEVEVVDVEKHVVADTAAAVFWLKNRRKDEWRDKHETTLQGPDGGPVQIEEIKHVVVRPDGNT